MSGSALCANCSKKMSEHYTWLGRAPEALFCSKYSSLQWKQPDAAEPDIESRTAEAIASWLEAFGDVRHRSLATQVREGAWRSKP